MFTYLIVGISLIVGKNAFVSDSNVLLRLVYTTVCEEWTNEKVFYRSYSFIGGSQFLRIMYQCVISFVIPRKGFSMSDFWLLTCFISSRKTKDCQHYIKESPCNQVYTYLKYVPKSLNEISQASSWDVGLYLKCSFDLFSRGSIMTPRGPHWISEMGCFIQVLTQTFL